MFKFWKNTYRKALNMWTLNFTTIKIESLVKIGEKKGKN